MDHRFIDEFSVAKRYVENALPPDERVAFEAHLVDCQECTDRLILAGMFHTRNGVRKAAEPPVPTAPRLRTGLVVRLTRRQLALICAAAVLLLLAIPTILIPVWKLLSK
jgi:predicted anti-sigma-YlaC factor YlaD